ncbi:ABC transporter E family member 2 [Tanacetum coccineum]
MTIAAQDGFKLKVADGEFADFEIIVLLRKLGTGKTAFIHLMVFILLTSFPIKQTLSSLVPAAFIMRLQGPDHVAPLPYQSVGILREDTDDATLDPLFVTEVMEPLQIEQLMDRMVFDLSREEAQRVALCVAATTTCSGSELGTKWADKWEEKFVGIAGMETRSFAYLSQVDVIGWFECLLTQIKVVPNYVISSLSSIIADHRRTFDGVSYRGSSPLSFTEMMIV